MRVGFNDLYKDNKRFLTRKYHIYLILHIFDITFKNRSMKISLQNIIILSAVVFSSKSIAQPVLTAANSNPVVGDMFVSKTTNYVAPGSAGVAQTWNLSAMIASGTTNYTVVSSASTPAAASFTNSNVCLSGGGTYLYYKTSAALQQNYGTIPTPTLIMSYSNPENLLSFPFNYANTFTDTWATTFTNGITFYRTGTSTVTADGYGTLTTPAGTFGNAMRVHLYQVYKDSANPGFPFITNYVNDEYVWYLPNNHYPAASVYSLSVNAGSPTTGGFYLNNVVTGFNELEAHVNKINVYPNPASQNINLNTGNLEYENITLEIYNVTGQKIRSFNQTSIHKENGIITLNIKDLVPDIYLLHINLNGTLTKQIRFIVTE